MRIYFEPMPPKFHGPFKPVECWHVWDQEDPGTGYTLTVEEGQGTVTHDECGLPVSLYEPEMLEMHERIPVTLEWQVERDYWSGDQWGWLLLTPTRPAVTCVVCNVTCGPSGLCEDHMYDEQRMGATREGSS